MGALAPAASWTSDDEHLLKNAIEAGMSIESLGKGAVQFSQKFTFQELKDRWHSLTSHASVSVEASPHIVESVDSSLTLSPETHILECKVQKSVQRKRMNESVPDCYNPMLKRVKSSVVEDGDIPRSTDHGETNQKRIECVVSKASPPCDLHKFEEDSHFVAKEALQLCGVSISKLNDTCCYEANLENSASSTDHNFARSSSSCMDLKELEEFLLTDIEVKDMDDDIPDLDSFLSDLTWGGNIENVKQSGLLGGGACTGDLVKDGQHLICSSEGPSPFIPAAHPDLPTCVSDAHMLPSTPDVDKPDIHISCAPQILSCAPEIRLSPTVPVANLESPMPCVPNTQILPSTPKVDHDLPGLSNGIICCVLNTEDTEIPRNDDFLIKLSSQPLSSSSNKYGQVKDPKTTNSGENKEKSRPESIQSQILSDLGINLPFIVRGP